MNHGAREVARRRYQPHPKVTSVSPMLSYSFLKRLHPVDGHSVVRCTLFSPNGQLFAAGINYEVVVWRTDDWAIEFVQQSPSLVLSLAWERNDRLYFGSQSGLLTLIVISDEVSLQ